MDGWIKYASCVRIDGRPCQHVFAQQAHRARGWVFTLHQGESLGHHPAPAAREEHLAQLHGSNGHATQLHALQQSQRGLGLAGRWAGRSLASSVTYPNNRSIAHATTRLKQRRLSLAFLSLFLKPASRHHQRFELCLNEPSPRAYTYLICRSGAPKLERASEWNGMEWNGVEWNGMEWNGVESELNDGKNGLDQPASPPPPFDTC